MGKIVRCPECSEVYRGLERLEDLRDNDSVCLVCNAPIEVADWDRVLASYEDDDDYDDVDVEVDVADSDDDWEPGADGFEYDDEPDDPADDDDEFEDFAPEEDEVDND